MKLLIIGATGGTGQQVMEQALARGHQVTAVARKPEAITFPSPYLTVVRGDAMQYDSLLNVMWGHDAVLSALGTRQARRPTTLYSAGIANILGAMAETGVRRLIAVTAGAYVNDDVDPMLVRMLVKPLLNYLFGEAYADMQRMEALMRATNMDWTIVRPARLIDGPRTGIYRAVPERAVPNGWQITRADVADYMLAYLDRSESYRTAVSLAV